MDILEVGCHDVIMHRFVAFVGLSALLGCPPPSQSQGEPAGTPTDPVKVCTQAGDVCQVKGGSQLGVCNTSTDDCPGPEACFVCMMQH